MKRKTKQQRKQEAWNALYQRVCDIMAGASGGDNPEDADCWFTGAQILPRIARSIELRLLPKDYKERMAYLVSIFNADEYENAKKLTDILFRSGIRA